MRATRDGKITADEWLELLEMLSQELGFSVDLSSFPAQTNTTPRSDSGV